MLGNIVEDMLSNWLAACDTVLVVKAKMMEMDTQLTSLDNTFAWNCMTRKARYVGLVDGGSGRATRGRSRDTSSFPTPQLV